MRCLIVLPTYNEIENLRGIIAGIQQNAPAADIVVVDDESEDGTGALADELSRQQPQKIFVIHRPRKDGLGRAYVAGFKFALARDYEVVMQMDADFSHDPSYLPQFLEQIRDHDLVLGSRYVNGISVVNWDLKRLILSRAATGYVRFITRLPLTDATSGFKCWRREVLEAIDLEKIFSSGYLFQVEMSYRTYQRKFRIAEIPIIFVERRLGRSKMDLAIIAEAILGVIRLRLWR
ncbi:MAG: dolichol-phosphate mannosyltransferase [Blastocatellia bacterium]|jgi:dolichol-phosphate mannosyltransferase|nr:dolichol-phosphate mannosyltransferase [Blastocatellia bacterium]